VGPQLNSPLASAKPSPAKSPEPALWCIHEGDVVSPCPAGNRQLDVRSCTLHGHCIRERGRQVAANLCERIQATT
jgi:hypothetical protein